MKTIGTKKAYKAPQAKFLEVNVQRVLCQSIFGEGDTERFNGSPFITFDDNYFEDAKY